MQIFHNIVTVIIILLIMGVITQVISLLGSLSDYFKEKQEESKTTKNNMRYDYTVNLLNLLIEQIKLEVGKQIQTFDSLNVQYDILNLDKDVSYVSTKVFDSIKSDALKNTAFILSNEYIMSFIIDNTRAIFLSEIVNNQRKKNIASELFEPAE